MMNVQEAFLGGTDTDWRRLYRVGGWAALSMLVLIPIQMVVFLIWPPPATVVGWFALFRENAIVGLLDMDLLLIVDYVLLGLLFLALFVALRRADRSLMTITITLELVAIATYFASTAAFEMLTLSSRYGTATTDAERRIFLAAGEVMVATWQGTAFNVTYLLSAAAMLLVSVVMLRSDIFGKGAAYSGLVAGVMMILPPTAGPIGLACSLLSLLPMVVWLVLVARRLLWMGNKVPL